MAKNEVTYAQYVALCNKWNATPVAEADASWKADYANLVDFIRGADNGGRDPEQDNN